MILNPRNKDAIYNQSKALYALGEIDQARKCLDTLLSTDSLYYKGFVAMGDCFRVQNKPDSAILFYTKTLDISPHYSIAMVKRGETYEKKDKLHLAFDDYSNAINNNVQLPHVYYSVAKLILELDKKDEFALGIDCLSKAIALKSNPKFYCLRGQIFFKMNDRDSSLKDFFKYTSLTKESFFKDVLTCIKSPLAI